MPFIKGTVMSAILEKIRAKHLSSRQQRLALVVETLTPLLSDIVMVGKNAGREVTDEDAVAVLKKHLKGVEETIKVLPAGDPRQNPLALERDLINEFLPAQLDLSAIRTIIAQNMLTSMKDAQAYFKHHYAGRYDGKLVAGAFR